MSFIVLRNHWCNIIVLNAHAPTEKKSDGSKDSCYEAVEQVYNYFPKYHTKILLGHSSAKFGRGDIFKVTIENLNLHQDSNDNGVRKVNFTTSKSWLLRSRCSYTETFINTRGLLLMGRLTTILITY